MGLTHSDVLVNADALCEIDIHTRKITRKSKKSELQQYDHNSERIGFTMERYVDGHDMAVSDRVAIKYLNGRQGDTYIVDDLTVTPDKKQITFTWLVSANATQEVASLAFLINFRCWNDDGEITYNWSTQPCSTYSILKGVPSMDSNPKEQYDFWAKYEGLVNEVTDKTRETSDRVAVISQNLEEAETKSNDLIMICDELGREVSGFSKLEDKVDTMEKVVPDLESRVSSLNRALADDVVYEISKDVTNLTDDFIELAGKRKFVATWCRGVWSVDSNNNMVAGGSNLRVRTETVVHIPNAIAIKASIADGYRYAINFVDSNGVRTKESDWQNESKTFELSEERIAISICRRDNSEITAEEHVNFEAIVIYNEDGASDKLRALDAYVSKIKMDVAVIQNGTELRSTLSYRDGGYQTYDKLDIADSKISFDDFLKIEPNSKLSKIVSETPYMYAIFYFDSNKNYIEETGWVLFDHDIRFNTHGYIKVQFRKKSYTTLTEDEKNEIKSTVLYHNAYAVELENLKTNLRNVERDDIINSCDIERGRINGASYVYIRIPQTTNNGKTVRPRIALTSANGAIDGTKRSALQYSRDNSCAVVVNAGLFNVTTNQPVGQTILDGVSVTNTPMEDDNGYPISDTECYPLCIDANGILSAPYPRSVDTGTMIIDGITQAITGWGKIVDNFEIALDDIKAEIVHGGLYIRQSIGQYQNGDYAICTVDQSRNGVVNEAGITYEALAQIFVDHGVRFAYSLDGGGSAQTVVGNRQLNPIYEGTTGRRVPTVISFEVVD